MFLACRHRSSDGRCLMDMVEMSCSTGVGVAGLDAGAMRLEGCSGGVRLLEYVAVDGLKLLYSVLVEVALGVPLWAVCGHGH